MVCTKWSHIAGGCIFDVKCTTCSYTKNVGTSAKLGRQYEVGTRICATWQLAGLTFETLEWIFKLAGGLPPLSRAAYDTLSKRLFESVTAITDADLAERRQKMKRFLTTLGIKLSFDGTFDHRNYHAARITGVACHKY